MSSSGNRSAERARDATAEPPPAAPAAGAPLLVAQGVQAAYGEIQIVWGVDLVVPRGRIVSIIGPNGAGKTTLLLALSGALGLRAGTVTFEGEQISGLASRAIVARGIAHVPEGRRLFRTMSVQD